MKKIKLILIGFLIGIMAIAILLLNNFISYGQWFF